MLEVLFLNLILDNNFTYTVSEFDSSRTNINHYVINQNNLKLSFVGITIKSIVVTVNPTKSNTIQVYYSINFREYTVYFVYHLMY